MAGPVAGGLVGEPDPHATLAYRALLSVARLVARRGLSFRVEVRGLEHLPRTADGRPAGGWIAAGLPHVTWIEPLLLALALPAEPRLVFFGDATTMGRDALRRWLVRRLGAVVPIRPGGGPRAFAEHVAAARAVLDAGCVFAMFPEAGPPAPPGEARPLRAGLGRIALATGAPVVPVVFGGTHELFRGRRLLVEVLPPVTVAALLAGPLPRPGTTDEAEAAHRVVAALHELTATAVRRAFLDAEPAPGTRRRWRWLTHAIR